MIKVITAIIAAVIFASMGLSELPMRDMSFEVVQQSAALGTISQPQINEPKAAETETMEITESNEESDLTDVQIIALIVMAEAEGESELGQRLVADTILNRIDSIYFPGTAYEVVYQPAQFSSAWNGRVKRCTISEKIVSLVEEEIEQRTNSECLYFNTGNYGPYGSPLFQEGNHYFSGE